MDLQDLEIILDQRPSRVPCMHDAQSAQPIEEVQIEDGQEEAYAHQDGQEIHQKALVHLPSEQDES